MQNKSTNNPMLTSFLAVAVIMGCFVASRFIPQFTPSSTAVAETQTSNANTSTSALEMNPGTSADSHAEPASGKLPWQSYDQGMKTAKAQNKHVFVQFYATWCGYCKKMDRETFTDAAIRQKLDKEFVAIRVTESSTDAVNFKGKKMTEQELTAAHGVTGFPTMLFLKPDGSVIGKIPGYLSPEDMQGILGYIGSSSYNKMNYEEWKQKQS